MDWLSIAEFVHNNCKHSATRFSPFILNYGRTPQTQFTVPRTVNVEEATNFATRMQELHKIVHKALEENAATMKRYADKRWKDALEYAVGQKVWLDTSHLQMTQPHKKFSDYRYGPFEIIEKISPMAFRLVLPLQWGKHIHNVFHVSKLRHVTDAPGLRPEEPLPPPPDIINDEEEYVVEAVIDTKIFRR